jgi:two-component system KDP operon response regulator KdpE
VESILLIDDDESVQGFVGSILTRNGYSVSIAGDGDAALEKAIALSPHLVILDLSLPGMSGKDLCKALRTWYRAPILVLSGFGEESTIIEALDIGADDFLTKPFRPGELLARIRALLRRSSGQSTRTAVLRAGDLEVDFARRRVRRGDQELDLTRTEFDIVAVLMRNLDCVVTSEAILGEVWGPHHGEYSQTLRVHIGHIRRKIEPDPSRPVYLLTEPGVGYRLQEPPAARSGIASPANRSC